MILGSLADRRPELTERMDDPECNPVTLTNTYKRFPLVNAAVSGWKGIYRRFIRPQLSGTRVTSILDVGCGGGDIARKLALWAAHDGFLIDVWGIDPDDRAIRFAREEHADVPSLRFDQTHTRDLVAEGHRCDVVMSNHLLHHLTDDELHQLLGDSMRLASGQVIHADIARSRAAYLGFSGLSAPLAPRSYIRVDGLTSIRRSFTRDELASRVPPEWSVIQDGPFRLLLVQEKATATSKEKARSRKTIVIPRTAVANVADRSQS